MVYAHYSLGAKDGVRVILNQFMLADLVGTLESALVFASVLLVPGYVAAWACNLLAFRQRLLATRLAIAVPMSIGICPIVTYYLCHFLPATVWYFYGACAAAFLGMTLHDCRTWVSDTHSRRSFKRELIGFAILGMWAAISISVLIDFQTGDRLYFPTVTYDYAVRSAFTSAISHTGVPPTNPYFFPGHSFPLRYHYFWLVLCSNVQRISGAAVSPRQGMLGGTVWCGIGLFSVVALYLRFFQPNGKRDISRRALIGAGLLAVTGLDILPLARSENAVHRSLGSIEWWSPDPVMAWVHALMWVPHHVAGLIACFIGFLLVWTARGLRRREALIASGMGGVALASAVGLSIYVSFAFAVFLLAWSAIAWTRRLPNHAGLIWLAALTALVLSAPYILEMIGETAVVHAMAKGAAPRSLPFQFGIRRFWIVDALFPSDCSRWMANVANFIALPLNYFIELGFFFMVGVLQVRRMWRAGVKASPELLCGFTMVTTTVLLCTFVRSSVIANNDLGWRGFMVAQFILLIWGADLLASGVLSRNSPLLFAGGYNRVLLVGMLATGLAGSAYEIFKIRLYPIQSDTSSAVPLYSWLSPDHNLGRRTFALRQIYEELKRRTPAGAIFQHNPAAVPQDNFHSMYADHQVAAETPTCSVVFGGDATLCQSRIRSIQALFEDPEPFQSMTIENVCSALSIDVIIVKDTDRVWKERESWVWKRKPMLANSYARAFDCHSQEFRKWKQRAPGGPDPLAIRASHHNWFRLSLRDEHSESSELR